MKVTPELLNSMADLSHLKLTENEKEAYSVELNELVDYIKKLKQVNTKDVKPTAFVHMLKAIHSEE
jgi:aspartyl-tRNA(Asn)/glutamyl-tRNA(Gln) amidotransferase subunit C